MMPAMAQYLVTGAAGFIGFHVARALLGRGDRVVGLDNLSPYYDVSLKEARIAILGESDLFTLRRIDLASDRGIERLFGESRFDAVIHLAAQAGVRYSLREPRSYVHSNLAGTLNVLEGCRHASVTHLVVASSSSVYGLGGRLPYSEASSTDHPASLYAATKKGCEAMAHAYAHLHGIPTTGIRLFTVYGPWGRPDMAYYKFALAMIRGEPIEVYGGTSGRDMTYIDDCVEAILGLASLPPSPGEGVSSPAPYRIVNIGNSAPVTVERLIALLEERLGVAAKRVALPPQPGDVDITCADTGSLERITGRLPSTPIEEGITRFVEWFRSYHMST